MDPAPVARYHRDGGLPVLVQGLILRAQVIKGRWTAKDHCDNNTHTTDQVDRLPGGGEGREANRRVRLVNGERRSARRKESDEC